VATPPVYPDLAGKVILVTGGASGIGAAHVRAFVHNGARVAFLDRQDEAGRALAAELPGTVFLACELTDLDALAGAVDKVRRDLGPVAGLINNAAVDQRKDITAVDFVDFQWMMDLNLRHVIFTAQKVIPHMRSLGGGCIVNTSATAWMNGVADLPLYSAATAAIVGFSHSLARRLGPDRIRVNAIAPGYVSTPRQRSLWFDAAAETALIEAQCIPDPVNPEDVANLAVFLCSDAGRMLTKQCFVINAGSS
jgi:NAD(P)-dependent dehydrogenase (short-subunit alcohol dehydrogenase family)